MRSLTVVDGMCRASDDENFDAFDFIRSRIPYSPVLQELHRNCNAECLYRRNLNGILDSDSYSDSTMILEPLQIYVRRHTGG